MRGKIATQAAARPHAVPVRWQAEEAFAKQLREDASAVQGATAAGLLYDGRWMAAVVRLNASIKWADARRKAWVVADEMDTRSLHALGRAGGAMLLERSSSESTSGAPIGSGRVGITDILR